MVVGCWRDVEGRAGWVEGGGQGFGSDVLTSCYVTESDGPPGKSIPGILQEQQQNLGPRRLLGSLLNTQLAPCFSVPLPKKLLLCLTWENFNIFSFALGAT